MFNHIKVSVKMIGGFLIVASLAAVMGIIGIISVGKFDNLITELYEENVLGITYAEELNVQLLRIARNMRNIVIFDGDITDGFISDIAKYDAEFRKFMDSAATVSNTPRERELLQKARVMYEAYMEQVSVTIESAQETESNIPPEVLSNLIGARAIADTLNELVSGLASVNKELAMEAHEGSDKAYADTAFMLITILVLCFVIGTVLGIVMTLHISRPVSSLSHMISEWSNGHLGMRLNIENRTDELGTMAVAADQFADDLQNVIFMWLTQIKNGQLDMDIQPRNSEDEIGTVFRDLVTTLRSIIVEDGGRVLQLAAEKDLTHRVRGEYKGVFEKMKDDINTVMQNLDDALTQVSEGVDQVTSASGQVASGSQSLAEGANEQASAIEEVSSSLEEMSSITKQNAENSNHGKELVASAAESLGMAHNAMQDMAEAIRSIKESSDNTSKILKTIDDIAFQTNLLALNAAVEAARAGEAGKGFAVVAEEVRNLAMRSAEASKNTAAMIEESVESAERGVNITEDVAKYLTMTVERAGKVGDIIQEIALASTEQATGIEQVNSAVAQMNDVTQQNAANSEESASASEEMSSQAAELATMVGTFKLSASSGVIHKKYYGRGQRIAPQMKLLGRSVVDEPEEPVAQNIEELVSDDVMLLTAAS